MAENEAPQQEPGADASPEGGASRHLIWAGIGLAVVALGAAGGLLTGGIVRAPSPRAANAEMPETPGPQTREGETEQYVYHDFEPVTVNLDEPRLPRYIRATITVAVAAADNAGASKVIERRKPELKHWLTVYLAGLSLDEVRGSKKLNRIRREIEDAFNEQLWPDERPRINHVLFKEFAVQ